MSFKNFLSGSLAILFFVSCTSENDVSRVLVFSKTEGFRHESIEDGVAAIKKLGAEAGFAVSHSEDAKIIIEDSLKAFDAVIFLSTTGDIFNSEQQYEFERYVKAGGGFIGIHAAADTEYSWPWYGELVGGYFNGHPNNPNVRNADILVIDSTHIACSHLPSKWNRDDEWYNYKNLNPEMKVLLNLDESSYEGGTNGENHPISWINDTGSGRMFYTGLGHTNESFAEENFLKHLLGGIQYVIGEGSKPDYSSVAVDPALNRFQKNVLDQNLNEPMELTVLPNKDILFIERRGAMKLYEVEKKQTRVVHKFDVHTVHEDGLLGLALDPDYKENKWIYVFYSPNIEAEVQYVSRFTFENGTLDTASEKRIIEIPVQREECCHSAGSLEFDKDGNLYIAVGDNTNPHESNGYAPIDGRDGRSQFDARRSSSNTNDLRGKILRIKPSAEGGYSIPEGNLFVNDSLGKPEIYVMGCRNPFRFFVDPHSGYLYWGDVGPDAGDDGENRGPKGHDEVNQARNAGYFGWPLFLADNKPYYDYDFGNKKSGELHDVDRPVNKSPFNTGHQELPIPQNAFIYYPYADSEVFPLLGNGSRNAMAAFVYHYDDYPMSEKKLPKYYDGKLFTYDWMRGWFMATTLDSDGNFVSMERFLPNHKFSNPTDVVITEDGEIYMLEYGTAWFSQNEDARLVHLQYTGGNRTPIAKIETSKTIGALPLAVTFDGSGSMDYDKEPITYSWLINGKKVGKDAILNYTFEEAGNHVVVLEVKDKSNQVNKAQTTIIAGNDQPKVSIEIQGNRSFYFEDKPLKYNVKVDDKEDGSIGQGIDASEVAVNIDYLEEGYDRNEIAMGHMTEAIGHPGVALMKDSDCYICHKNNSKSVGPTFIDIAGKYKGDITASEYLTSRIIEGGGGVWGDLAMAAHPQLEPEQVEKMVDYILDLKENEDSEKLPVAGEYNPVVPENKKPGGVFVMNATYVDKGSSEAGPISSTETIILRNAFLSAIAYDQSEGARKMTIEAGQFPGVDRTYSFVLGNHDGFIMFKDVDFTGIQSITAYVSANASFAAGGKIIALIDEVNGQVIGEGSIIAKENAGINPDMMNIALKGVSGTHDLYIKFESAKGDGLAMSLSSLKFNE